MKKLRILAVLVTGGVLAGCTGVSMRVDNSTSPYFNPGSEARVVMAQDVSVPPNQLRTFIQYGQQIALRDVNPHYPNCNLELNTLAAEARTIPAGTYAVIRVQRDLAPLAGAGSVQVAALGLALWPGGDNPTINFETRFFLQPIKGGTEDIRALNCSQWGEPGGMTDYPTPQEIAQALGKTGRLEY